MESTPITLNLGSCDGLPFVTALDQDAPHVHIIGPGYKYLIGHLMEDLMENHTPREIEIIAAGNEASSVLSTTSSYMDFVQAVDWAGEDTVYVTDEVERRLGLFEHNNVASLRAYADRVGELPTVVVFTDVWDENLQTALTLGGDVGVHIIAGRDADVPAEFHEVCFVIDTESYNSGIVAVNDSSYFVKW